MRFVSLFSGIEAASVAWGPLGWEAVAFAEIEPFPCAVLKYRFPDVPNLGDVTKIDWREFIERSGPVDVICGGSPCQSFSTAGGREGLDGESRLMFEYIRACDEVRPPWVIWENVPGVFSIDGGRAFGILIDALEKLGYGVSWRTLDAQFFGVAQRRRRCWLVGHLGDMRSAAVLFDADSVRGNTKSSREEREELTRAAPLRPSIGFKPSAGAGAGSIGLGEEVSPTLLCDSVPATCSGFNIGAPMIGINDEVSVTLMTADKAAIFAVMPSDTLNTADRHTIAWTGFNVDPAMLGYNDEVSVTLTTADKAAVLGVQSNQPNTAINEDMMGTLTCDARCSYIVKPDVETILTDDVVSTLLARDYKGPDTDGIMGGKVVIEKAYTLKTRCGSDTYIKPDGKIGTAGKGALVGEDTAFTLSATQDQTLIEPNADGYIVRRLTPRECERLQGFPDDWTLIPYRGKPAEECPDGPRYKALGNSWAVPCARWIGERIELVEELAKE